MKYSFKFAVTSDVHWFVILMKVTPSVSLQANH